MLLFFFFNDTATTEIYTLSLHDALPICPSHAPINGGQHGLDLGQTVLSHIPDAAEVGAGLGRQRRSEEHTSELQSRLHLVCRLLLEKKKILKKTHRYCVMN